MSVEVLIPFDLRERLRQQIKAIDRLWTQDVELERERCIAICEWVLREDLAAICAGHMRKGLSIEEIRKGK